MADVVYLHVGPPKTGTTYIQNRLFLNRRELARHGVRYPVGLHEDMFNAALDLVERPWGGLGAEVRGEWGRLVRRIRRVQGTAVVSHEILAGATAEQAARARGDLTGTELHVVLTARDIARQVTGEWQERLKHRRRATFGKFVRRVRAEEDPARAGGGSFWQVQELPAVYERWAHALPPERVHVVTVPQRGAPPGTLWQRFCAAVGTDPEWAPRQTDAKNPSMGAPESTIVRRLNRRLAEVGLDNEDYRTIVRQALVHDALARRATAQPIALSPSDQEWAEGVAQRWIDWARSAGVHVVGDLDDLRPVRPAETAWRSPDRPRLKELNAASMDAMVALVLEAARRPDPDERIRAKIVKVTDRLLP